jgi:hypothetical protein
MEITLTASSCIPGETAAARTTARSASLWKVGASGGVDRSSVTADS